MIGKMKQKPNRFWKQFIRYSVGGGAYFWSGYTVFAIAYSGFGLPVGPSKIIADIIGLTINFFIQRWWAFRTGPKLEKIHRTGGRYFVLVVLNIAIDYTIVLGLAAVGITPYIGQFVAAGFFTAWNYLWYKYWVFAPPHVARVEVVAKRGTK